MDGKEHLAPRCDTLSSTAPEAQWNPQMSVPTLKQEKVEYIDEEESACSDNMYPSEPLEPSEFVNYYESKEYVLKQLKKEFPEDECFQSHVKEEKYVNNMYQGKVKMERLEEQDTLDNAGGTSIHYDAPVTPPVVQCKLCGRIFKNSFTSLKQENEQIKVEINIPGDNEMIELHQCQYYDTIFKNSDNMLALVDDVHSQMKPKDKLCLKQLPSTLHPDGIINDTNNYKLTGRDDEPTTNTSTRGPRGKNAQYYRDNRARKRAEQEKESLNRTCDPSTIADSSTINVAGSVTSKKRKSAAEYQREYRARKKAKCDNILIDSPAVIPSISTGGFTTTHQSTIVDQLTTAGPSFNPPTTAGPSTSSDIGFAKPRRRKTPAEYQREYRARKKESLNRTSDTSTIADSSTINVAGSVTSKKRKSPAEYQREYRARKKAKRNNILNDSLAVIPSISTGGFTTTHQSTIVDQLTTAGPSFNPPTTGHRRVLTILVLQRPQGGKHPENISENIDQGKSSTGIYQGYENQRRINGDC